MNGYKFKFDKLPNSKFVNLLSEFFIRRRVDFYGYSFDATDIFYVYDVAQHKVRLENISSGHIINFDISNYVSIDPHYLLVLDGSIQYEIY